MPKQTPQQLEEFKALCRTNQLDPTADVWQQKQSGQWIIGRTGIEKIQARNNISVALDVVGFALDYAGVKATATRTVKEEGARTAKKLVVESLGSAHPKNCLQISYYLEMAEKRAKSRAILMLMGFYALGIYGEDEAEAFQRQADSLPGQDSATPASPTGNGGGSPIASEPPATPAASPSAAPAASTASGPKTAEHQRVLDDARKLMSAATSTAELKVLYDGLTDLMRQELQAEFTAAKQRIKAAVAQDSAAPVPRPVGPPVSGNLKPAGSDSALVDAYAEQPTMPTGAFSLATTEQKQTIYGLLDHPLITRKEKVMGLLNVNKFDTERARQLLRTLRTAITVREGYHDPNEAEQVADLRAAITQLLEEHGGKLEIEDEGALRAALANSRATLEELEAALRAGREAAEDAENDGTEREHLEQEMTA